MFEELSRMTGLGEGSERRRYLRVAADEGLDCGIEGADVVHIVGVSSEGRGMRVITDRELPANKELELLLVRGDDELFRGMAKAVWQETWDFEFCSRHVAGLELLGLTDEEREALVSRLPIMKEPAEVDLL